MPNPARLLAAMRKREDRPCLVCGKVMAGVYRRRRYCSVACHSKAARQRERERRAP